MLELEKIDAILRAGGGRKGGEGGRGIDARRRHEGRAVQSTCDGSFVFVMGVDKTRAGFGGKEDRGRRSLADLHYCCRLGNSWMAWRAPYQSSRRADRCRTGTAESRSLGGGAS